MDIKDIRTLRILEEIDQKNSPSQRYIAKKLNLSLGLVNSFLKRLAQKGYFKITTIPKNRIKYVLTPKGAMEKTRLTYEYIHYSFRFFRNARQKLKRLLQDLNESGVKTLVFYGVSDLTEIAYLSTQEISLHLISIVDESKEGEKFLGFKVDGLEILNAISFDIILVTAIEKHEFQIENLLKIGIPKNKIISIEP